MINKIISPNSVKFARLSLLVSALCVLCASVVNISAQEWKTVAAGVEYAEVRREFSGKPVNINLLRLDLKKVRLDVHHAMDAAIGTEKTSSIATRHKAFAAINAGFFRLDKSPWLGDSSGILMKNGRLLSESFNDRTGLLLDEGRKKNTYAEILPLHTFTEAFSYAGLLPISGINRERKGNEVILYDATFGKRTMTDSEGFEVVFANCEERSRKDEIGAKFPVTVCKSFFPSTSHGDSSIPENGVVLSFGGKLDESQKRFLERLVKGPVGKKTTWVDGTVRYVFDNELKIVINHYIASNHATIPFGKDTDLVAGVPQLIKNSKIDITWEQEKASKSFVETRHPRTAVAKLKDGKFLMLTADGRSELSAGLDLYDLAAYFLELGATDAMNLDGGGSTTMFLDGKVVNKPSDKEGERKVSDAILVTLRKRK